MKFDVFKHRLIKLKNKSLPGVQSHLELAPKNRIQLLKKFKLSSKTHDAAVSLCFYPDLNNDVILPLILRNEYDEFIMPIRDFKKSGMLLANQINPKKITSIGIVAYGRDHYAELYVKELEFLE